MYIYTSYYLDMLIAAQCLNKCFINTYSCCNSLLSQVIKHLVVASHLFVWAHLKWRRFILIKRLQRRFKGSFISQTEKLNKHTHRGIQNIEEKKLKMQKMKLYNCTLDKKWKINLCNYIEKNNTNASVQLYSFTFLHLGKKYFRVLYPSVLFLLFFFC